MEQSQIPAVAGLGGAALLAAVLSFGAHSPADTANKASSDKPAAADSSSISAAFTSDQKGPWYAFCQEYATTEFDHGEDPSHEWGIKGHHVPPEAEEGTVEITRNIPYAGSKSLETEKFNVRKHMVGDLPDCVPKRAKLRIVVATVPDPSETEMSAEFDRDIEAIQAAATAGHYNYTRFWFPWRPNSSVSEQSTDAEEEARRREEPGILCFHRNDTDLNHARERLFVLLVGETPTSGVNRLQLAHALYYREQLLENTQISDQDLGELKIAGPHFSSSFPAIQDVLDRALYTKDTQPAAKRASVPIVRFVSPDVSGNDFIEEFKNFCNQQTPNCTLQTLSLRSTDVRSSVIPYLVSIGYRSDQIAYLGEDESSFGGNELNPLKTDPLNETKDDYGLKLHFPRDLSSVRSLSDAQSKKAAESESRYFALPTGLPQTQLTVREPTDSDSPSAFGQLQETAEVARSLENVVAQMRRHRIRAVVIGASNPLDRIYLLEYLRDQLPDVRTATVNADQLELDRPHFVDLTGTIAVTTLPSLLDVRDVVDGKPVRMPLSFKSSRQLGEYLAVETLLDLVPAANNGTSQGPLPKHCISISVVGENAFHLVNDGPGNGDAQDPVFPCFFATDRTLPPSAHYTTALEKRRVPGYFLAFLWILGGLSALHFFSLIQAEKRVEGIITYPAQLKNGLEARRLYLLFVINNQLLLMNLVAVRLSSAVLGLNLSSDRSSLIVIFVLLALSLAVMSVLLIVFATQLVSQIAKPSIDSKTRKDLWVQMFAASLFLVWTLWMITTLPAFQPQSGALLERVIELNEGLSPVMPITAILLGYALWAWMKLKRLDWTAFRKIDLGLEPEMYEYLYERVNEVQVRTDALSSPEPVVRVGSLLVVVAAAVFLRRSLDGFDGPGFHIWVVIWGFVMLLLTVVTACFHARSIWNQLQKLLEWLETTAMRDAFQQIGSSGLLSIKIWDLARFQRSFMVLSQTTECIGALYGPNSPEEAAAKGELNIFVKAAAQGTQVDAGEIDSFHQILNVAMREAVQTMEAGADERNIFHRQNALRQYLALRLVAFIRYAMLQVSTLIAFVVYGYVLAISSIAFYPFAGRKTLGDLSLFTFVLLLIWIAMTMLQFQRDGMLSRLEGSTPGDASYLQLAYHLVTVGALPLLAIVTAQFPSVGNFVITMFRPVLGALH
jgi:hypothetical protein